MGITNEQFTKLVQMLLESEYGVEEAVYNQLMRIAIDSGNQEAQSMLVSADATDGWFYA